MAIGTAFWRPGVPARYWALGAVVAALPDLDAVGFRFGVAYGDVLGHRGLTHSLAFAAALSAAIVWTAFPSGMGPVPRGQLWLYVFLATASHGMLDALTNGGLGVAFFAPFHNARYFFPFTPIEVSPIGVRAFFTGRGVASSRVSSCGFGCRRLCFPWRHSGSAGARPRDARGLQPPAFRAHGGKPGASGADEVPPATSDFVRHSTPLA